MNHIIPRAVQDDLSSYGGRNPYGKPNWRIMVASDRLMKEAGVYRDWAPGLTTAEKGGLCFEPAPDTPGCNFRRHQNKPLRVVTEMREVRKYPHLSGWILERWFPASAYGLPEEWSRWKAVDGITPMLGPYPEQGDYEMIFGPWPRIPSIDVLERMISRYSAGINARHGSLESRIQEATIRYQYEAETAERKRKDEYLAWMKDQLSPMKSASLEASRWRQDLALRTGHQNEHIGVL